jgi:1-acyl-sn-glycerol-3-phosphate acyltransferase
MLQRLNQAVHTLYFICLALTITLLGEVALLFIRVFIRDLRKRADCVHSVACWWGRTILAWMPPWKISITGQHHIPTQGSFVLVSNHESLTDIFIIYQLNRSFRWIAKHTVFRLPILGPAMGWARYVPVRRHDPASRKKSMDLSFEHLKEGTPMVFFPEGTRAAHSGHLAPFKSGAFRLAQKAGVPVVPLCMKGSGLLIAKGSLVPQKADVDVTILPPQFIRPEETPQEFSLRIREQMRQVLEG